MLAIYRIRFDYSFCCFIYTITHTYSRRHEYMWMLISSSSNNTQKKLKPDLTTNKLEGSNRNEVKAVSAVVVKKWVRASEKRSLFLEALEARKKTCLPRFSWIILVSYWSARDKLKQKEQKKNSNTMLAISNWTKNGLSASNRNQNRRKKIVKWEKDRQTEPLTDLNH